MGRKHALSFVILGWACFGPSEPPVDSSPDTGTGAPDTGPDCDLDKDGHDAESCGGDDCDDSDATMNPDAKEVCDHKDNDCDDEIDEGVLQQYWVDADKDGWGDEEIGPVNECDKVEGVHYVTYGHDCDDTNADVFPTAEELCDGLDNDCDDAIDEGCDSGTAEGGM